MKAMVFESWLRQDSEFTLDDRGESLMTTLPAASETLQATLPSL